MLRQIGYVYQSVAERNDEQWMKNYLQCKEFFDKNGHFPEKTDDIRLRNWVNRWWKKTAEQQPDKAEMLSQLGFRYKSNIEVADERWYANYTLAKDFFDKHGRFPLYKEDTKIHSWARMWWKNSYLKNPVANEEKAQKLRNIGYKSHKPEDDEQNIQT